MEPETQQAPPVVAVVVVHEPGEWFDETIDSLAAQDYPNLRFLFLTTSDDPDVHAQIKVRLPDAFVRSMNANPGFGSAANEVLRLVEGDKGFFLFCHDDVAPDPDAVRLLVEEIYRSNAGAVGPKFVEWDDPGVLQAVGLAVDRFGELDREIEDGEVDQEQHDGVRDVFVLPSAYLLVRADLFREIGGFDPAISFHGEDVELCWRIHHSGARVVVAPAARVRHRSALASRRPDLNHRLLQARHRMRSVATLTGPTRLPLRSLEMVLLSLVELVVGMFTGGFAEAWASLRSLVGLIPRTLGLARRRKVVKPLRRVPEREVLGLQVRGSARLSRFLRTKETSTYIGTETSVRRWRESTTAPAIAWIVVLVAIFVGSRSFFSNGVPAVGEFLPFPDSPRFLLDSYTSSWHSSGTGATSPNPTGWATLSGLSVVTLFRMGLLQAVFTVGLVVVGLIGVWKLAGVFPSARARIGALAVYAASPLVAGAMSAGRVTTLVAYASVPWIAHSLRRVAGVETADPRAADDDIADGVVALGWPERLRRLAGAVIVVSLAVAFAPVMIVVTPLIAVALSIGTLLALAPWRTAAWFVAAGAGSVVGALLLNFPWATSWSWAQLVGPTPIGDPGRGLLELASFDLGNADFVALSLALYLPLIAAVALARAWRLTWAVRSGALVVLFGALAVWADAGTLPVAGPEAGVLLAPVALGLAIAAAASLASFELDVRGGSFGWRQPLGLLASAAVIIGVLPGVAALAPGDWNTPKTPFVKLLEGRLPEAVEAGGDYHVLLIGDARILPTPSVEYRDGISYALIGDGPLDVRHRWASPASDADDLVRLALDEMASSSTLRAGRLLAPLGIRFIVAPRFDDVVSTNDDPLPLPGGLLDALADQLDLTSVIGVPTAEVFENTAWLPTFAQLTGTTAEASRSAGAEALVSAELSASAALFVGADQFDTAVDEVVPGVVHLAIPFDDHWKLTVDGESIDARRAFGVTTAFDVERAGSAELSYEGNSSRSLQLLLQVFLWLLVLFAATRVSVPLARRRAALVDDETLIDLGAGGIDGDSLSAAIDPGLDFTGGVARPVDAVDNSDAGDISDIDIAADGVDIDDDRDGPAQPVGEVSSPPESGGHWIDEVGAEAPDVEMDVEPIVDPEAPSGEENLS